MPYKLIEVVYNDYIQTPHNETMIGNKGVIMLYKVKAKIKPDKLKDFFTALTDESIASQKPDGSYILKAMKEAKMVDSKYIVWYEACYCATPLRHERETVYDKYLSDFKTTMVYEVENDIVGESFWAYLEDAYFEEAYSF